MIVAVGVETRFARAVGDLVGEAPGRRRARPCRCRSPRDRWSSSPKPGAMCTTPVPSSVVDEVAGEHRNAFRSSSLGEVGEQRRVASADEVGALHGADRARRPRAASRSCRARLAEHVATRRRAP